MGETLAFLSAIGYTSQLILIKKGCKEKSVSGSIPIQLFVVSSAVLIIIVIYLVEIALERGTLFSHFLLVPKDAIVFVVLDGLLGPMAGLFLLTKATELIGPSKTSIFRGTNPIFAAILAAAILNETPGVLGVSGVALLVTGIIIVSWNNDALYAGNEYHSIQTYEPMNEYDASNFLSSFQTESTQSLKKRNFIGTALALLSGLSFAIAQTARGSAIERGAAPEPIVFWGTMTSFVTLLMIHYFYKNSLNFTLGIERNSYKYYICAGAGFVLGASALALSFVYIDVWKAVAIRNLQPVISILMSWLFLKQQELITKRIIVGALFVIAAIWILAIA